MIITYRSFLFLALIFVCQPAYSQDRKKDAEKYTRTYCLMLANSCSMAPKNLDIKLEKCLYNQNPKLGPVGWRIWSRIEWRGQVSRMNYKVRVYLEVNEPANGKPGKTTMFFLDYSYLLAFRCIKDENTKPVI